MGQDSKKQNLYRPQSLLKSLFYSLGIHFFLALTFLIYQMQFRPLPTPQITVELIEVPNPAATKTETPTKPTPNNIIVQQDESQPPEEKPVDSRYLSRQNQIVKKQTIAQQHGEFENRKEKSSRDTVARSKGDSKPKLTLKDLSPSYDPLAIKERQQNSKKGGDILDQKGADSSKTNDYVKDVDSGEETLLNTREFKYFTYFSRIRRQLSEHWEPSLKDRLSKMFRQGRRIASNQDHVTRLLIVLDAKGVLIKVQVLSESGVQDLDDVAIEAFRSAAPFPNPPKGIIESDGTIRIPWNLILES